MLGTFFIESKFKLELQFIWQFYQSFHLILLNSTVYMLVQALVLVSVVLTVIFIVVDCIFSRITNDYLQLPLVYNSRYQFIHRFVSWLKQILISGLIVEQVSVFVLIYWDCQDVSMCEMFMTLSMLLTLCCDHHGVIVRSNTTKTAWIVVYAINAIYFTVRYVENGQHNVLALSVALTSIVIVALELKATFHPSISWLDSPPTAEYTSNFFSFASFSFLNPTLIFPAYQKASLEFGDVPGLQEEDSAEFIWGLFNDLMKTQRRVVDRAPQLSIYRSLFALLKREWIFQGLFHGLQSCAKFTTPLALQRILLYVSGSPQSESVLPISVGVAVLMLFVSPFVESFGECQTDRIAGHLEIRIKSALIGAIYNKALTADLNTCEESTGRLNNLISVDVDCIQSFFSQSHYLWSTPLEIAIAATLLFLLLGSAAWGGIAIMVASVLFALKAEHSLEKYQEEVLRFNDQRLSIVGEVLNNIRIIKYSCWESKFMRRIAAVRKTQLRSLRNYSVCYAVLIANWEIIPTLVAMAAFMLHTYVLGHTLLPSTGFAAMTIFNCLRFPLSEFPEIAGLYIQSRISVRRIEHFLSNEDIKGLFAAPPAEKTDNSVCGTGTVRLSNVTLGWATSQKPSSEQDSDGEQEEGDLLSNCVNIGSSLLRNCGSCFGKKSCCCCCADGDKSLSGAVRSKSPLAGTEKETLMGRPVAAFNLQNPIGSGSAVQFSVDKAEYSTFTIVERSMEDEEFFLEAEEADEDYSHSVKALSMQPLKPLMAADRADHCGFDGSVILSGVTVTIPHNALCVVVGMTGSGKSTLLQGGLLGECSHIAGETAVEGRVSYVSQSAWIQNASLRDNILFGSLYVKERYEKVLFACALEADLKLLPAGDLTEIGEKGVNLSGGQQQRVSLARAAYARSDIILLDDPLSAVDTHVGEHIFRELIVGFLSNRTRVLVTHNVSLAIPAADLVVCLDGSAKKELLACCPPVELPAVLRAHKDEGGRELGVFLERLIEIAEHNMGGIREGAEVFEEEDLLSQSLHGSPSPLIESIISISDQQSGISDSKNCSYKDLGAAMIRAPVIPAPTARSESSHSHTSHRSASPPAVVYSPTTRIARRRGRSSSGSFDHTAKHVSTSIPAPSAAQFGTVGDIVEVETKSAGEVPLSVYWCYLKAAGGVVAASGLLMGSLGVSFAWLLQNYCLGVWMHSMQQSAAPSFSPSLTHYLGSAAIVVTFILWKVIWSVHCTSKAAMAMHSSLMRSVLLAPCSWFDATPIGRIVNRFSKDISTVDSQAMIHLVFVMDAVVEMAQITFVIMACLPALILPFVPVILLTVYFGTRFLHVSRELKRLESLKKSPVFVLFSETLQGLSTIRSFRQENRFFKQCCARLDELNRCHLYLWLSTRWLNFRMQMLGALITGCVGLTVVLQAQVIGSTVAGIVLIYSLTFCDNILWLAKAYADCQMDMNSVDRIQEYSQLPPEKYLSPDLAAADSGSELAEDEENNDDLVKYFLDDKNQLRAVRTPAVLSDCCPSHSSSHSGTALQDIEEGGPQESPRNNKLSHFLHHSSQKIETENWPWPSQGTLEFRHVYMTYKSAANPVLRDVSFRIPGRMKVGVVGRTGAGKSSLIAALFRIVEPYSGDILIDGVNVLHAPLHALRSNIAIVPQDPTLFQASVRFNLDPFNQHSDEAIWAALRSVHLDEHVANMDSAAGSALGKSSSRNSSSLNLTATESTEDVANLSALLDHSFDSTYERISAISNQSSYNDLDLCRGVGSLDSKMVAEKGSNFSVGQRQLLCLARAILRRAAVLVLDECTASVDHETDALIQKTVRTQLAHSTVICIAHRLHTIAYYDLVLVMDQGAVAEFDDPFVLISRPGSVFHQMCSSSGDYNELFLAAKEAHDARSKHKQWRRSV